MNCTAVLRTPDKTWVGRQDTRPNCRGSTSRLRQRGDPEANRSELCLHVVGGPGSWTGGPLASSFDGYLPYCENSMLGNNEVAGMLPFVSDDAGTPFAVGIIAMDDKMAIKARP